MTTGVRHRATLIGLFLVLLSPLTAPAHETDQYTIRQIEIVDSTDVLNEGFNVMLADIAQSWNGGPDRRAFAKRVYKKMGGRHYIDKYERWARQNPEVPMIELPRNESIYQGGPFWSTRMVFFFGLGPVIRLNDELVGYDKMGHFLSSGWKYHKRYLQRRDEAQVIAMGQRFEAGVFGFITTGVFSNADLVANYEGYLFFRSLFEDGIVPGKPAESRLLKGSPNKSSK